MFKKESGENIERSRKRPFEGMEEWIEGIKGDE
jgi:hypothetical protein